MKSYLRHGKYKSPPLLQIITLAPKCIQECQLLTRNICSYPTDIYNDPKININWPVKEPILSERDKNLSEGKDSLHDWNEAKSRIRRTFE